MFWRSSRRRIWVEKEVERQLGCFVEVSVGLEGARVWWRGWDFRGGTKFV